MDAASIITAVVSQCGTDASRATVLTVLNEAYSVQCADARWFRTEASIGTTVSGIAEYAIPATIIEAYGLTVGTADYQPIGEDMMRRLKNGSTSAYTSTQRGLYSQGANGTGDTTITLHPTPTVAGTTISLYAAVQPTALTDSGGSVPITPVDTHTSLIDGTAAIIIGRIDERPDLAGVYMSAFVQVTEKIRRRKNALATGSKSAQLAVKGVHW